MSLLHHIYQNIPNLLIIPQSLLQNYLVHRAKDFTRISEQTMLLFKESINKEIKLVQDFLNEQDSKQGTKKDDIIKMKSRLADLEKDTDLLFLHINK